MGLRKDLLWITNLGTTAILFVMDLTKSTMSPSSRTKTLMRERKSRMLFIAFGSVVVALTCTTLD